MALSANRYIAASGCFALATYICGAAKFGGTALCPTRALRRLSLSRLARVHRRTRLRSSKARAPSLSRTRATTEQATHTYIPWTAVIAGVCPQSLVVLRLRRLVAEEGLRCSP